MNGSSSSSSTSAAMPGAPDKETVSAQVIAQLARDGVQRFTHVIQGNRTLLVWPDGQRLDLEAIMAQPDRPRGFANLGDPASFIAYVQRHRTTGTHLCGAFTATSGRFDALLDYHPGHDTLASNAQWSEHFAAVTLAATPEWVRWLGKSGTELDQKTFAEFLEDNAPDITVPATPETGAKFPSQQDLLSLALTLQVKTDVQFGSQVRLQNGEQRLTYLEKIDGTYGGPEGKLAIPEKFALALAPFQGAPKYLVTARLRYRAAGGKATFRYEIERPHKVVEDAWNDVRKEISDKTGFPVLLGSIVPQPRALVMQK